MPKQKELSAILKTLTFFNQHQIPLTEEEIHKFLLETETDPEKISQSLSFLQKKRLIHLQNGYYSLLRYKNIYLDFKKRRLLARKKLKKAYKIAKLSRWIPFLKGLMVINSVSFSNAKEESDIDFLVITSSKRLWICRAFLTTFLGLINLKKTKRRKKDRACLGFFITEDHLDLEKIRLSSQNLDIYLLYWLAQNHPVLNYQIYLKFIETNDWAKRKLPNWSPKDLMEIHPAPLKNNSRVKKLLEQLFLGRWGNGIEKFFRKIQLKKIWNLKENHRQEGNVLAKRDILKLHPYDKRPQYQKKWQEESQKQTALLKELI